MPKSMYKKKGKMKKGKMKKSKSGNMGGKKSNSTTRVRKMGNRRIGSGRG